MKKFMLIICLCLAGMILSAEKVTVFKELVNPDSMVIDDSDIYITQQAEVFIYDAKTFKLKKKFGSKGHGPREIPPFPILINRIPLMKITPLQERLFIAALGKILYFTKGGEYIEEFKYPSQKIQTYINFFPFGSDMVCQWTVSEKNELFITASIVDQTFQLKKELKRKKVNLRGGKIDLIASTMIFEVYKDRVFVVGEDFSIDVFDNSGKLHKQIRHRHERIKFNDEMRKQFDETLKFMFKSLYEQIRNRFYYPEHLPTIFNMQFSGPYLYVITWKVREGKRDLFIFKLDGTFVEKTAVPLKMVQFIIPYPLDIAGKSLFQLVDNEDTEEWELHRTPIH